MIIGFGAKDFFILLVVFTFLVTIIRGSIKLKERLNEKIASGQLNKKQTIILWAELSVIMSVSIYCAIIGMYNAMGGCNSIVNISLNAHNNGLFIIFGYMKYAFFVSLIVGIICFILIKLLSEKR